MESDDVAVSINDRGSAQSGESHWFSAARLSLLGLLLAAPLAFGAVQVWAWGVLAVAQVLVLSMWAIGCIWKREIKIQLSALYFPATLFLLLGAVQLFGGNSLDPIGTREALIKLITDVTIFFLAIQLFSDGDRKSWHGIGLAVTIYAFALSLFSIFQYFTEPALIYWSVKPHTGGYVFGPYVNHNHYAGLMEMLIPVAFGCFMVLPESDPRRWPIAFAVLISGASVVLCGSRGGTVSLLVEALIFGAVLLLKSPNYSRASYRFGIVSVALVAAIGLVVWIVPANVLMRWQNVAHMPELTYYDRRQMSLDSLNMFYSHPWIGVGLGSFKTSYTQYQTLPTDLVINFAHNDFVQVLAEAGSVGAVLALFSLGIFFRRGFGNLRMRLKARMNWIQMGSAIGIIGLLIHSVVDFNLHIPANAAWFAMLVGIVECNGEMHPR